MPLFQLGADDDAIAVLRLEMKPLTNEPLLVMIAGGLKASAISAAFSLSADTRICG